MTTGMLKKGFALYNPFVAKKVTSVTLFSSPPRPPPCHRYIALAHIAYGGLGGHTRESCPEAVGKRALPPYTRAFPPRAPPCFVSLFVIMCCCKCQTKHYHYSCVSAC